MNEAIAIESPKLLFSAHLRVVNMIDVTLVASRRKLIGFSRLFRI